jgi:hypothetical protein
MGAARIAFAWRHMWAEKSGAMRGQYDHMAAVERLWFVIVRPAALPFARDNDSAFWQCVSRHCDRNDQFRFAYRVVATIGNVSSIVADFSQ